MAWTDERVRLLKLWWADGDSAGTIAKRFDTTTRNAVIGKIHRLKLTRHPMPLGHKRLPRTTKPHVRKGRSYHPGGGDIQSAAHQTSHCPPGGSHAAECTHG